MSRAVLLVEIGASGLPAVTPVETVPAPWVAHVYTAPPTPPPGSVTTTPAADSVTLNWDAVPGADEYLIEVAPAAAGPWKEVARVRGTRYTYTTTGTAPLYFRVRAVINGVPGTGGTTTGTPAPVPTEAELVALQQQQDQDRADRVAGDLANAGAVADEAAARAAAIAAEQTARANAIVAASAAEATARTAAINASAATQADNLLNTKIALEASISNEATIRQSADASLASQIATISAGTGEQFDTGGGIWYFDTTVDGWGTSSGGVVTAEDGWLRLVQASGSVQNILSPVVAFDSTKYRYVKFRMRKVGNPGTWRGWLRWITDADQTWDAVKEVQIPEPTWDANNIATIDIRDIPWAAGANRIRFYPFFGTGDNSNCCEFDWIAIGRPSPGASAAALQEEREARITGDSAQATARETLAAQLRGSYTGTDAAALTSGLVYSERQARVTADAAIASDVSSLQVRMPTGSGKLASEASVTAEASARAAADTALGNRTSAVEVRMPTGTDKLANEARVVAAETAAANANTATANRVGVVEARMPAGSGALGTAADVAAAAAAAQDASDKAGGKGEVIYGSAAPAADKRLAQNLWIDTTSGNNTPKRWNGTAWVVVTDKVATDAAAAAAAALAHSQTVDARVTTVENASVSRDDALALRATAVEAKVPVDGGRAASEARVNSVETAAANANTATANRVGVVEASLSERAVPTLLDASFESGGTGWNLVSGHAVVEVPDAAHGSKVLRSVSSNSSFFNKSIYPVSSGTKLQAKFISRTMPGSTPNAGAKVRCGVRWASPSGATLSNSYSGHREVGTLASWQSLLHEFVAPAGAAAAQFFLQNYDHTSGRFEFDGCELVDVDVALQAVDALVTTVEQASVTRDDALALRATAVEAKVPVDGGRAASEARVNSVETAAANANTATATQLAGVKATAEGAAASVTTVSQVIATSNAVNLSNPSFETDSGWTIPANVVYFDAPAQARSGARGLRFNGTAVCPNTSITPATPGDSFRFGGFLRSIGTVPNAGGKADVYLRFFRADGSTVGNAYASYTYTGAGFGYVNLDNKFVAPAETAGVQLGVRTVGHTSGSVMFDDVYLERLSNTDQKMMAAATTVLDVNGYQIGTRTENDGFRGGTTFVMDYFRLLSPGGMDGLEIQNGYIRAWKGNSQTIMGVRFGAAGEGLMKWFGPNIGAAACTKANATSWEDDQGRAHFNGSITTGDIINSAQTTVLTMNPTIEVGPFTTNGRVKQLTAGYSANSPTYTNYFPGRAESAGPPAPPTISQSPTTLTVSRKVAGNPSWVQVASTPISHGSVVTNAVYIPADAFDPNLPGGGWQQDYYWSSGGSITYSDTQTGTANFSYSAAAGSPTYTKERQTLSVRSVEPQS